VWTQWPISGVYDSTQQRSKRHNFKIAFDTFENTIIGDVLEDTHYSWSQILI